MHVLSFVLFTKQGSAVSRGALARHLASFGVFHRGNCDCDGCPSLTFFSGNGRPKIRRTLEILAEDRYFASSAVLTIPTRARDSDAAPASGEASLQATAAV